MRQYETKVGGVYYFRRAVPDDLLGTFTTANGKPRIEWKMSMRTKDRAAARAPLRALEAETDRLIGDARAARGKAPSAPPAALCDRITQSQLDDMQRRDLEGAELDYSRQAADDVRAETDTTFAAERALRAATAMLERDRENIRLSIEVKREAIAANSIGIIELFDRYAAAPGRSPKTMQQWRRYIVKLVAFVGHDDATRLTLDELRSWRNHLRDVATFRGHRLAAGTINGSYLAAVNVLLGWAADDGLLPANVARDLRPVSLPAKPELRSRVMSEAEAKIVLTATLAGKEGGGRDSMASARRWLSR